VIIDDKPNFIGVSDLLKYATEQTRKLLGIELEIKLSELEENWHFASLEKIFIEKRIYRDIEEQTTWEGVLEAIQLGLKPHIRKLKRPVTTEDIVRLTEIRIKRISKYDAFKADEHISNLEKQIEETKHHLEHLTEYAIAYYQGLLQKYGKGRERKTEIRPFETIQVAQVAIANTRFYANKKEGFIGTGLKKDEFVFECSDVDQIIVFRKNGSMMVTKVAEKTFVGKEIIHIDIFRKNDDRTTYNMIYLDGKTGIAYAKRYNVTSITRDKEYDLTRGTPGSKVLYFSANPNGEAETVSITLTPGCKARNKHLEFSFADIEIKGRSSQGNQVTKYPIKQIKFKEKGVSTLEAPEIWYDDTVGRLNREGNGICLGRFTEKDRILCFYKDGTYELTDAELINRYDPDTVVRIEKFNPDNIVSAIYFDAKTKYFYAKRFRIEAQTLKNKYSFIKEGEGNYLEFVTTQQNPVLLLKSGKKKSELTEETLSLAERIEITGWKTIGTKIADKDLKELSLIAEEASEEGDASSNALTLF
jgi:topoisomerase-4 subunit A